ncbi:MAG: hypothetical protein CVU90_06395 [Firmicutes bacterium HGW-Firmicutes-15]|nr:MAG: hypothetical protein CVU90_06395 [Firmicutes bacterium HGW-Firmicutes-15]
MKRKNREFLRYIMLFLLFSIGLWQTLSGNSSFGSGLMGSAIFVFIAITFKQRKIRQMEAHGMNPYDERAWFIAGRAAYFTYLTFALGSAFTVLIGSIWGPQILVNPYNFLGICLSILVLLYICFYYYFNYKL